MSNFEFLVVNERSKCFSQTSDQSGLPLVVVSSPVTAGTE